MPGLLGLALGNGRWVTTPTGEKRFIAGAQAPAQIGQAARVGQVGIRPASPARPRQVLKQTLALPKRT